MEEAATSPTSASSEEPEPLLLLAPPGLIASAQEPVAEIAGSPVQTAIVLEVSVALLADPPTQLTVIEVANEQGVVTLSGEVASSQMRHVAGEIASSHPDVAAAINNLEVTAPPAE